jgi:hypothetical protein
MNISKIAGTPHRARNAFRGSTWVTGLYGFNGEAVPSDGRVIEITFRVLSSKIAVEITKVVARVGRGEPRNSKCRMACSDHPA